MFRLVLHRIVKGPVSRPPRNIGNYPGNLVRRPTVQDWFAREAAVAALVPFACLSPEARKHATLERIIVLIVTTVATNPIITRFAAFGEADLADRVYAGSPNTGRVATTNNCRKILKRKDLGITDSASNRRIVVRSALDGDNSFLRAYLEKFTTIRAERFDQINEDRVVMPSHDDLSAG